MRWGRFGVMDQVKQLSTGALQRIANGLHKTLQASTPEAGQRAYPAEHDMVAWREQSNSAKRCGTTRMAKCHHCLKFNQSSRVLMLLTRIISGSTCMTLKSV